MASVVIVAGVDPGGSPSRELLAYDNGDGTYSLSVVGTVPVDTHTDLTAILAALPATLGTKSAATSLAVALSTEDAANLAAIADRLADLSPPVGGSITGDDAAHAFGALTGPGILVVAATGGTARIGAAASVSNTVGLPIVDGASYDAGGRRYAAVEAVKVYVPVGVTVVWGAHQ